MRILISERMKQWGFMAVLLCVMVAIALQLVGYAFDIKSISVFATAKQADALEVKNRLLMDVMQQVGVGTAEDAARLWAQGVKTRSAAMQYASMDSAMKNAYEKHLEKSAPDWITGVSNPWVSEYCIESAEKTGNGQQITLTFSTATSAGATRELRATLMLVCEDGFWRITAIDMEEDLLPYTGF